MARCSTTGGSGPGGTSAGTRPRRSTASGPPTWRTSHLRGGPTEDTGNRGGAPTKSWPTTRSSTFPSSSASAWSRGRMRSSPTRWPGTPPSPRCRGRTGRGFKNLKLTEAAEAVGHQWTGKAHGSLADAQATLAVQDLPRRPCDATRHVGVPCAPAVLTGRKCRFGIMGAGAPL